MIKDYMNL